MILSCFHTTIINHFRNNVHKGPPSEVMSDAKIHRNTAKLKSIYYRHKVTLSQVLHPPQKDREITKVYLLKRLIHGLLCTVQDRARISCLVKLTGTYKRYSESRSGFVYLFI